MSQQNFSSAFTRRSFLQYSGATVLGGSLLAACGGSGSSSSNSGPALTQWYHQYGETGTQQAVLRYASEYTKANVSVKWIPGTGNAYPDKVHATLLGSGAPDVFELTSPSVDLINAGALEPLDDLYNGVKSEFAQATLDGLSYNGHIYGAQIVIDTQALFYRKSLLQKANIAPPKTMDDLIVAAQKLTNGNMKGLYIGQDGGVDALHLIAMWAAGAELLQDKKITFSTDKTATMLEKFVQLNKSGNLLISAPTYYWDPTSFIQGLCAMQWTGLWAYPTMKKAFGDDLGAIPLPSVDAQTNPATISGGWAEMVNAKGKNVQAAKDFVKWLWINNQKDITDFNQSYGFHIPPRSSMAAAAPQLKAGLPAQIISNWKSYGHAQPVVWDSTMDTALADAMSNIIKNGADPKSTLDQAAAKCQAELDKVLK